MSRTRRLILVTGTSFGAGKTVLAAGLAQALDERGDSTCVREEGCLLATPAFARFDREIADSDPEAIETLLEASRWVAASGSAPMTAARVRSNHWEAP